ncbi:MAG: translation initiation factor IF-2, partial [Lachnospiraceae bacterium]
QGSRPGQYQNRDGQGARPGQYQNRDGQGSRPGQYQNRDGQGARPGQYQNRDGQGSRPGQYQNRDGQGARPGQPYGQGNRGGQYQNRDGQGNRGGQYQSRDGQGNRGFQSGGRGAGGGFAPDAKETAKEQEKHRDEQEKRRQNQDKRKKEHTFSAEDGFRGGKTVKGAKVTKPERPQERKAAIKEEEKIKVIILPEILTIKELADKMKIQPAVIVKKLFLQGKVVTVNQEVTYEQAEEIAMEFEILCEKEVVVDVIEELLKEEEEDLSQMTSRPPVICVMGHVDHGKTSLLDAIRKTHVIDKEAGGITQHIGAYVVNVNGQRITFLDTPGHEAFTAMRMRGANSTDIAILVVAADDGVMPQTVEAINHAKAAGIEIIVAVNKIDKPSANIDRVKQELSEYELVPEDWGGSTVFAPVSAKSGEGIEQLLEMILLTSEILELKADEKRQARGLVIEAQLDKGRGPVSTVLVQKGTLKVGDFIAAGACYGKVRAMIDDKGKRVKEATPSTPVEILGLNDVPNAGEIFVSPESDKEARNFAATFISQNKVKLLDDTKAKMSLDDLFTQIQAGNLKELNLIIKADVQGSVEAVKESLLKLTNEEVVVKIIHGGVGAINESDVILASASNAIIIGFNVRPDATAKATAESEGVDVRLYSVIYKAIEDVEAAMKGMLDPVFEEKVIGHAEIRQIFKASGIGNIAGSYVLDGIFQRNCTVRISREGKQIFEGKLASLKRFKDDVKEVKTGFECGLVFEEFNDFAELDIVEAYIMVEVPR